MRQLINQSLHESNYQQNDVVFVWRIPNQPQLPPLSIHNTAIFTHLNTPSSISLPSTTTNPNKLGYMRWEKGGVREKGEGPPGIGPTGRREKGRLGEGRRGSWDWA
ncbi:hypothetical protein Droror1_Dr00006790 [Drosera rotundifolia]